MAIKKEIKKQLRMYGCRLVMWWTLFPLALIEILVYLIYKIEMVSYVLIKANNAGTESLVAAIIVITVVLLMWCGMCFYIGTSMLVVNLKAKHFDNNDMTPYDLSIF